MGEDISGTREQPDDAAVAVTAAQAGAQVVRTRFGTALTRHLKDGGELATDVDLAAERAVRDELARLRPADAVMGEELGGALDPHTRTWLVDPLCGTVNFAATIGVMAVNVALLDGERTMAAASVDPLREEIFWSDGTHARLRVGSRDAMLVPDAGGGLVNLDLRPTSRRRVQRLLGQSAFAGEFGARAFSSTLPLAWVAAGRMAGYITEGQVSPNVHFAAGLEVCRAAGVVVTALDGGPVGSSDGLLAAADRATHDRLGELLTASLTAP